MRADGVRRLHAFGAVAGAGAGQHLLGQRDRGNPDLVAVRGERQSVVRLCRAAVVRPGAVLRLRHVRRRHRHRPAPPVVLAGVRARHFGGDGDGAGVRHLCGPPDMALLRHHHRGVLADLLLHRGDDEAAHRRRRRDQFHPAADLLIRRQAMELHRRHLPVFFHSGDGVGLLLSDASGDPQPAREGVSGDPRQRRAGVVDRTERLSASSHGVCDGGISGRRGGRVVCVLRPLRLRVIHVLPRLRRSRGVGHRRRGRHAVRADHRHQPVHHHSRARLDALGASFLDRRDDGDPGRDPGAERIGRALARRDRPVDGARCRRIATAKLRADPNLRTAPKLRVEP